MKESNGPLIELGSLENTEDTNNARQTSYAKSFNLDDYESIRLRRIFAYFIDVVCIAIVTIIAIFVSTILGIISFGILTPLLVIVLALVPLAYHTFLVGSDWNATIGMRFMNIRMELDNGGNPDYMVAFLQAALFYFSVAVTSSLILLVSLFNPRGRCLHDYVTSTVIRRIPLST
ncbi:MAG: RDD family protein [Sneathiella sp.]|uniref:RDD family protein n=1 Tax=Sneathiella sp. TaxID=1964365 RepID=UPI003002F63B